MTERESPVVPEGEGPPQAQVPTIPEVEAEPPTPRIPPVAEALGYAGGALALAALVTIVLMFHQALGVWGQTGISAVVAAACFVGGFFIERLDEPAAKRLSQFLLAVAVAATGCAVGFLVYDFKLRHFLILDSVNYEKAAEWGWFTGMLTAAGAGGVVWWNRRTWLQHLVFGVGVGMASLLVLPLLPISGPDWGAGLTLALVGVVWGALTLMGWLPPENAGLLLSTLGILGGIELAAVTGHMDVGFAPLAWAVWLGIAVSISLIAAGAWLRRYVVLGMGAAGLVMFAIELVTGVFKIGMGTPVAFLMISLVLLAAATWLSLRLAPAEKPSTRILAEIAGYAGVAFAVAGAMTLLTQYWERTGTAVHISVPAVLAVVAYACAIVVERAKTDSARRLSQVLYGGAIAAVGGTAAMIVYPIALHQIGQPFTGEGTYVGYRDPQAWASFAGAIGVVASGATTWTLREWLVPELATGFGVYVLILSGFGLLPDTVAAAYWISAAVMLAVGIMWVVLGLFEKARPSNTALAVGCATAIFGLMQLFENSGQEHHWAPWLGMAFAVAAIVASIRFKRGIMLGFGAAAVVLFAFSWTQMVYEGRLAGPVILLVTGVVFIAMAVLVAVMLPRLKGTPPRERATPLHLGPHSGAPA